MCVVNSCVMFYVFFPPGVYVGTLNLIASIPDPCILTLPFVFIISQLCKANPNYSFGMKRLMMQIKDLQTK